MASSAAAGITAASSASIVTVEQLFMPKQSVADKIHAAIYPYPLCCVKRRFGIGARLEKC